MTKMKSNFISKFFISLFVVFLAHIALIYFDVLHVNFKMGLKLDLILFIVFSMGMQIIVPGIKNNPKNFVNRFLVLTTVQLLAVLSILVAVTYLKIPDYKIIVFHIISIFIILMLIQSFLLIKESNRNN